MATAPLAAPALVAAASVALASGPAASRARRRLALRAGFGSARPASDTRSRRLGGSAAAALVVSITVGGPVGIVTGLMAAAATYWLVGRLADPAELRCREAALRDLPLALDLLGSALRAGQPATVAAACVSAAVAGPVGAALGAVARAASLGSTAD
ncbi:MAG: secretion system protein, partial [Actinomycetota bacterium]|nr:secretion system protein [Actinomycetota bacterium]